MTNDERDQMLIEIHSSLAVIAARVEDHQTTLYGNGRAGLKAEVQRIDQQQLACPARAAFSDGSKSLKAIWAGVVSAGVLGLPGAIREIANLISP